MILVFGGTTEGRKAAKVCDQSGKPFYYATKGSLQQVEMANGICITGGMDAQQIIDFVQEHQIKLLVDAAHPFAENLHKNISFASEKTGVPVVRYERNFERKYSYAQWFDSYQSVSEYITQQKYQRVLALTGVNTIAKLKNVWTNKDCYFRILDRDESRQIAQKQGFSEDKLLYYQANGNELELLQTIKPEVIITKESGISGGFEEKYIAAKTLGIPFLVVERPKLSEQFINVYGEHGLRKTVEQLVDGFFKLKTGFTTGTCATAACKAALTALLTKQTEQKVSVTLPNGEWVFIPIAETIISNDNAIATVIKDAGDDPDVTNGTRICATVKLSTTDNGIRFLRGEGVGKVTLPGVGLPIGSPAINKTPQKMMKREVFKVLRHHIDLLPEQKLKTGVSITISVPDGKELAKETFNPKIGIVDGISIIGTSGVVKPFSSEAFVAAIHREMQVAKALGTKHIIINSGAKSEQYIQSKYPELPPQAFIHYGNFIGETLEVAHKIGMEKLTIGIMMGKAVKLAAGNLDTHSHKVVMDKNFILDLACKSGVSEERQNQIVSMNMARELWSIIPEKDHLFYQNLLKSCQKVCAQKFDGQKLEILLIDNQGNIVHLL